jgi:hypothetical protein
VKALVVVAMLALAAPAHAECRCLAVAGDVTAAIQAEVAKADGLYARGEFSAALDIYARAYATSKENVLLYAQGMAKWQLGATAEAKLLLQQYASLGGTYKDRAEAGLRDIGAGVGVLGGGAVNAVAHVGGDLDGGVRGGLGVTAGVTEKPTKIAGGAAMVLGVVAIAAITVVGVHSITAGVSTDAEFDPKFDIGLGVAGIAVGASAIYLAGLTTAGSAVKCASLPANHPIVAPIAVRSGGGLAAVMSF